MKKILYIVSTLKRSGPIIVLANIIKYLDRDNFEPIVLTLSTEPEDSLKEYFENDLHTKVETLGLLRIEGLFFAKKYIEKFIVETNIDIVHSHGFRADGLVCKLSYIKSVSTLHNYPYYDYTMTYGNIMGYIMAKIHLRYLKKLNSPFACSKSISIMLKKMNNYNIDFVRNGTDTQRFQNLDKKVLRERFQLEKDIKVFVSVGHLSNRKDPLLIIEAFKIANIENSILLFLGDGHLKQECVHAIGDHKNIVIVGSVSNVHEYLGASDYFISASLAEGLPNTVLEAMACGLPCVLSNIPPHSEIYEINKDSSILFEIKDINGLSEKIKEVMNNDYEVMSKASKKIVFGSLSAKIMSQNYQIIYEKLLN